ncbi:hypothetical protein PVMG_03941 [Plasmodium vivax Mauritania I]|uniref:Clathrin/coatomer adaptor adaptin-like N-terminal domain-containing protein n=1 Tax=Plasmodium vivax Mauritania I TaxID=1035515 RepID=A0A0J9TMB0_PLAVI|nr:hypothetical protein PVMG_03941 [Plasmodium vivax Mauritania I]
MNGSFIELIKDIKRDDSVQNVERNYALCVRSLREMERRKRGKEKEPIFSLLTCRAKDKSIALMKLLYLQMHGRKIDPEHNFTVMEMLTSSKYVLRRRGHLFLHHSTDREDVTFLSINLFRKELYRESFPIGSPSVKTNVINSIANMGCAIVRENIGMLQSSARSYLIISGVESNGPPSRGHHFPIGGEEPPHEKEKKKQFTHTNCISKETNVYNTALVLNTLSNICTSIMSSNLHTHVLHLLNSSQVYIKKKAIVSLYRVVTSNLETLPVFLDSIKKSFLSLYSDESSSYDQLGRDQREHAHRDNTTLCCLIVNVLAEVFSALEWSSVSGVGGGSGVSGVGGVSGISGVSRSCGGGAAPHLKKFLAFIPLIYSILNERLSLIDNWKFIKIVKFLKQLVRHESRIYKKFLHLIVHVLFTNKAKSVVYECLSFLLLHYQKGCAVDLDLQRYAPWGEAGPERRGAGIRGDEVSGDGVRGDGLLSDGLRGDAPPSRPPPDCVAKLLQLCFAHLAENFHSEDKNIVYVTTKMYVAILASPDVHQKFIQHNMMEELSSNVLSSLDHDVTIRKSLLRIIHYLMNESNFQPIAYNILTCLYGGTEGDFAGEYVDAILLYGQKKGHLLKNINLYVFLLFYMLCMKNHRKEAEVVREILRVNGGPGGTTHITTNFLSAMYVVTYGAAVLRRQLGGERSGICSGISSGVRSGVSSGVRGGVSSGVDNHVGGRVGKIFPRFTAPLASPFSPPPGDPLGETALGESHSSELMNQMSTLLQEAKPMDAFARYDLLEYITGTLHMHGSDQHDRVEDPYKDVTQVEVATFEHLIYFVYAYLEEAHHQIKEYQNEHFLKVFFFSLYLFFTHFSVASILWYVAKIFFFFYQYEGSRRLVRFYMSKLASHVGHLLGKRNIVETVDCCATLRSLFCLVLNGKHAGGGPTGDDSTDGEDSPTGEDPFNGEATNRGVSLYTCVTDYLQLDPSEESFNLDRPFKYHDAFFLHPGGSPSGGSPSGGSPSGGSPLGGSPSGEQRPSASEVTLPPAGAGKVASSASAITTSGGTASGVIASGMTASGGTASALTVDEAAIAVAGSRELCANGDLQSFLRELSEEQSEWRQRDQRTFHQVSQSAHMKLYFQVHQDERLLRLYFQLVGSPVTVQNLSVRTSLQVIKCQVAFTGEEEELLLLGDDQMAQDTPTCDELTSKRHAQGGPLERNHSERIRSDNLTEVTSIERVPKSFLLSTHFEIPSGSVKLAYSYWCNSTLHEEPSVEIPFVPLEPAALSIDELTNVKKRRGVHRIVAEEITVDEETHPTEFIFSCFVFLAEHLHLFFFNMGKVFSNLRCGCCADTLRLIFCAARTSSREAPPDKTVLLINVHHRKTGQAGDPTTYRVEAKMKVLNDCEEECVRMLNYAEFHLTKLLTGRLKIRSPRIALTRG